MLSPLRKMSSGGRPLARGQIRECITQRAWISRDMGDYRVTPATIETRRTRSASHLFESTPKSCIRRSSTRLNAIERGAIGSRTVSLGSERSHGIIRLARTGLRTRRRRGECAGARRRGGETMTASLLPYRVRTLTRGCDVSGSRLRL